MRQRMRSSPAWTGLALAACLAAGGCGKTLSRNATGAEAGSVAVVSALGASAVSTKNTTRIGGSTSIADAAAVAVTVFPGLSPAARPQAVVLVDAHDWAGALASSMLAGPPLHAPLLFSQGRTVPGASSLALSAMRPTGAPAVGNAQVIRVGGGRILEGYRTSSIPGSEPAALAVAIERLVGALRKRTPRAVIVTAADGDPAMTAPAAGLAAETGAPILFVRHSGLPATTSAELRRLRRPSIYVIGPPSVVASSVVSRLERYGSVTRIAGPDPAANAVAVARYSDGSFGWGVVEPGHGLVFASASRPLDGPAAAVLSASGDYGPLLLLERPDAIPDALGSYLSDLQPGSPPSGPVHGVYNHGWLIGDGSAISAAMQSSLDARLEISSKPTSEVSTSSSGGSASEQSQTTGP